LRKPLVSAPIQTIQTKRTLLAYGGLAMPIAIAEIPIINYLPAFYAQELHLSVGLVGAVLLAARLWDGLYDLLVGWLSDRSTSRFGRRKPWTMWAAPFLMISTWFLCNPPEGSGLLYLGIWAVLFYTAFTSVRIPHQSWGTELATDYVERSRVFSFREAFTMLGTLFSAVAPLIFLAEGAPLHEVLFLIAVTIVVLVPLTVLPLAAVRDPPQLERPQTHLLKELASLAQDRVLRRFALARLLFYIEEGMIGSLLVFAFSVGLELPNKIFWLIFIIWVATLCALPLTLRLVRRFEKHHLLAGGLAIYAMALGALVVIPAGNFIWAAVVWGIVGVANSAVVALPTSIVADIVDHAEVETGERRSGAYVAIDNLMLKVGMALGLGLGFGLLALIGYDPGAAQHTAADAWNIRLLGFGVPALLLIPSIVLVLKHPITRKVQRQLRERIESGSASGASSSCQN
jgi:glycoside/pentoside/hexuronide:cation symporter, GPH family